MHFRDHAGDHFFSVGGKKLEPAILSLLRKGGLDIPFMLLLNALAGVEGIVWATPIADFGAMLAAAALFVPFWKSLSDRMKREEAVEMMWNEEKSMRKEEE